MSGKLKEYIERLGTVWVEGEITQWGLSGGNAYGKVKDLSEDVTLSFRVWSTTLMKLKEEFRQGDRVVALVKSEWWPKGGTLTMQVYDIRHVGVGDLLAKLEALRRKLADEGLFDLDRKQRLPFLPGCIGLVTAKDSDAEKDVLRNAQLRWPAVNFRIRYATMQGDRAWSEVSGAIKSLDADPEVDVIIVARGGGDFQNLLPFSDERLIRVVAECRTPVVSAIGHEADHPLLDDVADLRASTPTDAAKRVVPDISDELARVRQARGRMAVRATGLVSAEIDRLASIRSRPVLADPDRIVSDRAEELTRWVARGAELVDYHLERAGLRIVELRGQLRTLSPQGTLERGYAIARLPSGAVLRRAADAVAGERIRLTLASGELAATVDDDRTPVADQS
ncbi:MAG: exodeoxyribonuclease VII large subunit [Pseudolysinimonas sp.]|uniref:exodeoxyribonuclease VII large subunit n=1 Tax=Pseudolysinimonas sp. TaxID=2680009 RepID=UPI0032633197